MPVFIYFICLIPAWHRMVGPPPEKIYPVSAIPDEIKQGSHAVIRNETMVFELYSPSNATLTFKHAVTVFDESGDDYNLMVVPYNKSTRVVRFDGKIFNSEGTEIDKLKSSEVRDNSAISGFSLYDDERVRYARMVAPTYPYTVEYEFEIVFTGLITYPSWSPVDDEMVGIENSEFIFKAPKDMEIRYREFNLPSPVSINAEGNGIIYRWELRNQKPVRFEEYMPPHHEIFPVVYMAPVKFSMDGFSGDLSSWKEFGTWIYKLNLERDSVPPTAFQKINDLVSNIKDQKDKIKRIYKYLQENTRYVSVQLGIGGYRAFDALYVDEHGYGDCKALVNYMHALLKCVQIPSFSALVNAGANKNDIVTDFPSQQFNHVILCVPNSGDTVWLECTSQNVPFGFLGEFTGNRHVLLITQNGGTLIKSPAYPKEINTQVRNGKVEINPEGSAAATIATELKGLQYDQARAYLYADRETQKKWLYSQINIPDFELKDFSFSEQKDPEPAISETLEISLARYVTTSGKRIFFQPNLMNQIMYTSAVLDSRLYDFNFTWPYIDVDSIAFILPADFHLEFIPDPVEITCQFGTYSARIIPMENKILYIRAIERNQGRYPKEAYPEYREFVRKINSADKMKLVLVKTT